MNQIYLGGSATRSAIGNQILACTGLAQLLVVNILVLWGGLSFDSILQLELMDIFKFWSVPQTAVLGAVFICVALANPKPTNTSASLFAAFSGTAILVGFSVLVFSNGTDFTETAFLSCLSAALIGAGSAGFFVLWEHVFSRFTNDEIAKIALVALVVSAIEFLLIDMLPKQTQIVWFPILVCAATACLIASILTQATGNSMAGKASPRNDVRELPKEKKGKGVFKALRLLRDPLFCVTSIGFAVALTRIIALDGLPETGIVNTICIICIALVAVLLYIARYGPGKRIDLFGNLGVSDLYRVLFPVVTTALLLLSVIGDALALGVTVLVYVIFSLVSTLMLSICMSAARENHMNPLVVYGAFAGCVYFVFAAATAIGTSLYSQDSFGAATFSVCVLLVFYVLTMAYTAVSNKTRKTPRPNGDAAASKSNVVAADSNGIKAMENMVVDETAACCKTIALNHKLTARETEVFLLIARGRDVPSIARQLYVSENTVRSHSKSLYTKLGIHSKQEMLDLIDNVKIEGVAPLKPDGVITSSSISS